MTRWYEIAVHGREDMVRAFVAGFLAARGEREGLVLFGSELDLEAESLGERLKELFVAGSHAILLAPEPLAGALADALVAAGPGVGVRLERRREVRAAAFTFHAEMFSRALAEGLRQALRGSVPEGTLVEDLNETEEVHPEARGVELYAPVHDYIYRASGRVAGLFPGVVEMRRRLADMEFVDVGGLHLDGIQVSNPSERPEIGK